MGDNFKLKRTNFLSIVDNDYAKTRCFHNWIHFLNEHSNISFSLTAKSMLNVEMLKFVHKNSTIANIAENPGFKFPPGDPKIRTFEDDLNEFLQFLRNDLEDDPDSVDLLKFFRRIQATLENGKIPRYFYKKPLLKKWNMFLTIISYVFSPKTGGWHGLSVILHKMGLAVAYNLSINFVHLIMKRFLRFKLLKRIILSILGFFKLC